MLSTMHAIAETLKTTKSWSVEAVNFITFTSWECGSWARDLKEQNLHFGGGGKVLQGKCRERAWLADRTSAFPARVGDFPLT